MENILEIEGLSKKYQDFCLGPISFILPKGSIMGFVGENGAGKTTTIKLILNQIRKDSGSIHVFGKDYQKEEIAIKEQIGVVLDEGFFYEMMTAKQIGMVMKSIYKNWDEKKFKAYLEEFHLAENQTVKEYSKGMRMKLSIIVAMSHHPQLLILDEPTSGLDPVVRTEILDMFLDFIQDEEKSVLMSTHITSDLERIADYITFLNQGKIVFSKSRDEIMDQYGIIKCSKNDFESIDSLDYISYRKNRYDYEVLVKNKEKCRQKYQNMMIDRANIEEIMLLYIKGEKR